MGLDRVVDTTYRMAASDFLRPDLPESVREPLRPYASFATGANEMSTLDMAAGMQSIANEGVHHEPYFIEKVDDSEGRRLYTHQSDPERVLESGAALTTIDTMKATLTTGTAHAATRRICATYSGGRQDWHSAKQLRRMVCWGVNPSFNRSHGARS